MNYQFGTIPRDSDRIYSGRIEQDRCKCLTERTTCLDSKGYFDSMDFSGLNVKGGIGII